MQTNQVKAVFLMADYGHDPTETAIPWKRFTEAGFACTIVTENGKIPECDKLMLEGWTQRLLGAAAPALTAYKEMTRSPEWQHPLAWTKESFTLADYELVFLTGGHQKGVRQILDSKRVQQLLVEYFPLTAKPSTHLCVAICHGPQLLAHAQTADGKSVLHNVATTALPGITETSVYYGTRLLLGDYYKTYGANSPNVETVVRKALKSPNKQWLCSANLTSPFVVEDKSHNYISGRWPGDAELLSKRAIRMAREMITL